MESSRPGLVTLLRLLLLAALGLGLARFDFPTSGAPLGARAHGDTPTELAPGHLPDGEASAEAGAFVGGPGFVEIHSAPRRPVRTQAGQTGSLPLRSLDGQRSRIRSVNLSRFDFARALAEASAGAATQATTLPPPALV